MNVSMASCVFRAGVRAVKRARPWGALFAVAALSARSAVGLAGESVGERLLTERFAPLDGADDRAVEESIVKEIALLAEMNLGRGASKYYEGLMKRWEECATKRSVSVLEGFIKKMARFERDRKRGTLPWGIFGTLDLRVQKLWFRLKTEGMQPEEKARIALWGMLEKGAPVPLDREVAIHLLRKIGEPKNPVITEFLDRPADGEWDDLTTAALDSVFPATEERIRYYFRRDGTLGQCLAVNWLAARGQYGKCLNHLVKMIRSGEEDQLNSAMNWLRYMKEYRETLIPELVSLAGSDRMFARTRWGGPSTDGMRDQVFGLLAKFGKDARTVAVLKGYLRKVSSPQAWLEVSGEDLDLRREGLDLRRNAVEEACRILKEWGELEPRAQ